MEECKLNIAQFYTFPPPPGSVKLSTLDIHKKFLSDYEVHECRRSERHALLKKLIELPSMLDKISYKRPARNQVMLLSVSEFR